jgi:hypothetical protein
VGVGAGVVVELAVLDGLLAGIEELVAFGADGAFAAGMAAPVVAGG